MKEKLEHKFDLESLARTKLQLNEIQLWATTQRSNDHQLYHIIDGLCRIAHMYNVVITQQIRDGEITTGDPQDYIDGKMTTPYAVYKKDKNKQESI